MTGIPDIEVNADRFSTVLMGAFFVLILILLPWHIAHWVEGGIKVSGSFEWANYLLLALAIYVAVDRKTDKYVRIIAALASVQLGTECALHLAHPSEQAWHFAGWALAYVNLLVEIALLVGIATWFRNRVKFVKASHDH